MNAIARHPSLFLLLQADLRVPSAFLRKGAGQDMMPAGFLIFGPFLVLVAGALRLVIGSLSDPSSFWIWTKTDYRIWLAFAALLFIVNVPHARETRRRSKVGREITPTYFVGWSRLLNFKRFSALGAFEATKVLRSANCGREPALGFAVSGAVCFVDLSFGLYLVGNVFVLWLDNLQMFKQDRELRIKIMNQMAQKAKLQRILEQIESPGQSKTTKIARVINAKSRHSSSKKTY